jgi:hypothetical protein
MTCGYHEEPTGEYMCAKLYHPYVNVNVIFRDLQSKFRQAWSPCRNVDEISPRMWLNALYSLQRLLRRGVGDSIGCIVHMVKLIIFHPIS